MTPPVSFDKAGRSWIARPEYADSIRAVAQRIDTLDDSTLIKRNLSREVHRLPPLVDGGPALIVKWHKMRGAKDTLKYAVVPSRAKTEWLVSLALEERNIPVARTLGYAETRRAGVFIVDAVSVSEALPDAAPLGTAKTDPSRIKPITDNMICLVAKMHAAGVDHTDLHGGNLLASPDNSLTVIDLHAVKPGSSVSLARRIASLGQLLWSQGAMVDTAGRRDIALRYIAEAGISERDADGFPERIERWIERYNLRRFKSRTRRCIINSSRFSIEKPPGRRIHRLREMPLDDALELIQAHRRALTDGGDAVIKHDRRSSLTRLPWGGSSVCVKEFASRGASDKLVMRLWRSRGKRAWIAANGFTVRGVPTPEPLAMIDDLATGDSFVISRFIDDALPLDAWVAGPGADCPPQLRRELVDRLAAIVGTLHAAGVYAEDLSPKNVIVRREGDAWDAYIVDVDNTHLWRSLTMRRRLWNLAQLNDIPDGISPAERLRFLLRYIEQGNRVLSRHDAIVIMGLSKERHERWRRKMADRPAETKQ